MLSNSVLFFYHYHQLQSNAVQHTELRNFIMLKAGEIPHLVITVINILKLLQLRHRQEIPFHPNLYVCMCVCVCVCVQYRCVIDGRADVWSLGCVAYALAFGGNPFESPSEGLLTLAIGRFPSFFIITIEHTLSTTSNVTYYLQCVV